MPHRSAAIPSSSTLIAEHRAARFLRTIRAGTRLGAAIVIAACLVTDASAQFGGGGGGFGGGAPGGAGGAAPAIDSKPKFREHVHSQGGIPLRREKGDAIVLDVKVVGNQAVSRPRILQELHTRKDRFYDYETVLGDVRRLNDMGSFDHVTFKIDKQDAGVVVTFSVHERPVITRVIYHGNRRINERELIGRSGLSPKDPISEFAIESARRRLMDYYHEEGFNQAVIQSSIGIKNDDGAVVFRINEGPLERIGKINIHGNTIVSDARLKKIIKSRGPIAGVVAYANNKADLRQIDQDVDLLAAYYHNLGFLTATVGKHFDYDSTGKWLTVNFVINEGPRFKVNDVQIIGNQYVTAKSLRARLELKAGDMFDGTVMRRDVGELVYGYGELGFIYAEVEPKTVMRDEANVVDLVYEITEGDRWKVGEIRVNIEGDPHLMKETTMLNLVDLREGDWIDRRTLELNRRRLERSQLLENNPQVADPPDIKVIPRDDDPIPDALY